jgi:hypothetical protein
MEAPVLTFVSLDEHIEALPEHPSHQIMPARRVRWGNAVVAVSGISTLLLAKLPSHSLWVAAAMLVLALLEIGALGVVIAAQLPSLKLTLAHQRREYAETLDFDMPHHERLISWLRSFPPERLTAMSTFACHRLERFRSKLPVMAGGIEKLGILPVLAAIVVQFKDVHWPPQASWMQIALFAGLMVFYWLCMLMLSLRFRLELYDALLRKALEPVSPNQPSKPRRPEQIKAPS